MAKSAYEDRLDALRGLAHEAARAIGTLPKEARADHKMSVIRLDNVLGYTGVVLARTDAELVSDQANTALTNALTSVRDNLTTQPQAADQFASEVLQALVNFPVAQDQAMAQDAKEAAKQFGRSSRARLGRLGTEVRKARTASDDLEKRIDEQRQELEALIEQRKQEVDTAFAERRAEADLLVTEMRNALEEVRTRVQNTETEQAETFRSSQDDRASEYEGALESFKASLDKLLDDSRQEVESRVGEIRRMEDESAGLVGAIGLAGTAERYGLEFKDQKRAANIWRWITVVVVGLAVIAALLAAAEDQANEPAFVSKVLISIGLGALATYAARQSARHRSREVDARALQLELTAFGPFIEALPDDQQVEERVQMTRKTFGRTRTAEPDDEGGPTILSQVLLRRREPEEEQ